MRRLLILAAASGCASTSYLVERAPLDLARARGEANARVPAQLSGSGAPVYVDAGAVHDDGGGRAHIINRTMVTGYAFLGVAALHLIPGLALIGTDGGSCPGEDACGFGAFIGIVLAGVGAGFAIIGATLVLVGMFVRPHEWPRTVRRSAYLGLDGAVRF